MSEKIPGSWRGVINRYEGSSEEVKGYFDGLPGLIEDYIWEVSLGYMFIRVERALNMMLYCGAAKVHRAHSETAYRFVDQHHMTRKEFQRLFKNIFGECVPMETTRLLNDAENVRNKVIHGKSATAADQRKAIVKLVAYAEAMNELVYRLAEFKPFTTNLRGFVGRREALDASTTVWLMKGLGFTGKAAEDAEIS